MLDRSEEYQWMAEVERDLWWYRALHEKCHAVIQSEFGRLDINILDAGCGTGGLLWKLREKGYSSLRGFDLSEIATSYCRERRLDVSQLDLRQIRSQFNENYFEVIVSNDTLYYLTEAERRSFLAECCWLLRPGGLLICNLPASEAFSGIHDLAVGIKHRFSRADVLRMNCAGQFNVLQATYWPFLLSPLVFAARALQRTRLRFGLVGEISSDVKMPASWVNAILLKICQFENKFLRGHAPFGSSLFLVLRRQCDFAPENVFS